MSEEELGFDNVDVIAETAIDRIIRLAVKKYERDVKLGICQKSLEYYYMAELMKLINRITTLSFTTQKRLQLKAYENAIG